MAPGCSAQSGCAHRSERETAARISQEIGNLMKEIETLVEEKTKESLDVSRMTREGERMGSGPPWPSLGAAGPGSPCQLGSSQERAASGAEPAQVSQGHPSSLTHGTSACKEH